MRTGMNWTRHGFVGGLVVAVAVLLVVVRVFFGGGERLEDRTTAPSIPVSAIEQVAAAYHFFAPIRRCDISTAICWSAS